MGGDGWDSSDLDLKAADGGYYTNHYSPDDPRPEVQNFLKAYGAAYKDDAGKAKVPDALAALAYDATNLLLIAIKDAGAGQHRQGEGRPREDHLQRAFPARSPIDAQHNPIKAADHPHDQGREDRFRFLRCSLKFQQIINPGRASHGLSSLFEMTQKNGEQCPTNSVPLESPEREQPPRRRRAPTPRLGGHGLPHPPRA